MIFYLRPLGRQLFYGRETAINNSESEIDIEIAKAIKSHDAVAPALNFFAYMAPAGIPLCYFTPCKEFFPEPLASLSSTEWQRLVDVMVEHGLVIKSRSDISLLPEIQKATRKKLDDKMSSNSIKDVVGFLASISDNSRGGRLDEVHRLGWHLAAVARFAIYADLKDQLAVLLKLLDISGRVSINAWPDRAIISHKQGIEICEILNGSNHHGVAIRINNLGQAWHRIGGYSRAEACFKQALDVLNRNPESQDKLVASLLGNFALLRRDQRQIDGAAKYFREALDLVENECGLENQLVNICVNGLGRIIKIRDGAEKAIEFLGEALTKSVAASGVKDHPNLAVVFCNLGLMQLEIGKKELGKRSLVIAMQIAKKSLPKQHPMHKQILAHLQPFATAASK
ncbi:MAG: tetratricopeptide repeat protein [Magnetococcales bacterium]|nr:tetratricopeptide repeat protein [Magnetococcales bacterium]